MNISRFGPVPVVVVTSSGETYVGHTIGLEDSLTYKTISLFPARKLIRRANTIEDSRIPQDSFSIAANGPLGGTVLSAAVDRLVLHRGQQESWEVIQATPMAAEKWEETR